MCKKSWGYTIVHRFSQGIWFLAQGEHRTNTTSIWFSKETVIAKTMLYTKIKVKVSEPDGETVFFDIVTGVL